MKKRSNTSRLTDRGVSRTSDPSRNFSCAAAFLNHVLQDGDILICPLKWGIEHLSDLSWGKKSEAFAPRLVGRLRDEEKAAWGRTIQRRREKDRRWRQRRSRPNPDPY